MEVPLAKKTARKPETWMLRAVGQIRAGELEPPEKAAFLLVYFVSLCYVIPYYIRN
jgi:hypothetical protein